MNPLLLRRYKALEEVVASHNFTCIQCASWGKENPTGEWPIMCMSSLLRWWSSWSGCSHRNTFLISFISHCVRSQRHAFEHCSSQSHGSSGGAFLGFCQSSHYHLRDKRPKYLLMLWKPISARIKHALENLNYDIKSWIHNKTKS